MVKLFQYFRDKVFILRHCSLHSTSIWKTIFSSHTFRYNVSVYQTQHLYPHPILVTIFQYFRGNNFFLTHVSLHCFCMSESTVLSSPTLGYTVLVYHWQQFYVHILLAALCQYISHRSFILARCVLQSVSIFGNNIFIFMHCCFIVSLHKREQIFPNPLMVRECQCIGDNSFILTSFWIQIFSISDTRILSSLTVIHTASVYQRQQIYPQMVLAALWQYIIHNSFILATLVYTVSEYKTLKISLPTFDYKISVHRRQQFYNLTLLVTLCQCIRHIRFILTH